MENILVPCNVLLSLRIIPNHHSENKHAKMLQAQTGLDCVLGTSSQGLYQLPGLLRKGPKVLTGYRKTGISDVGNLFLSGLWVLSLEKPKDRAVNMPR